MRLIPSLRGVVTFNFMSAFAFLSVMMTYFGVNFYLSGLHSYASGDRVITPKVIYLLYLSLFWGPCWFRYRKFYKVHRKKRNFVDLKEVQCFISILN